MLFPRVTAVSTIEVLTGSDLKKTLQVLMAVLAGTAAVNGPEVTYSDPGSGGTDRAKHAVSTPDGTRTGELL